MGVDIVQLGNHNIQFKGKTFSELVFEIKPKLENIKIDNIEYIKFALLDYYKDKYWLKDECEYIKRKLDWTYREENDYFSFEESKCIEFRGPCGIEISFEENYIEFFDPPYRFWYWFYNLKKLHRDEWRKYMYNIITAFGGNRVIYLPDNMMESSEYYQNNDSKTFNELENGLINDFGTIKKDLDEIIESDAVDYYIDTFNGINWKISAPIESLFGK